jgi:hypothetical protein
MDHHLSPPHHPPHHQMSLPTFARSIPVEVATQPASTRTSFTRVDHTRPGTSAGDDGQRDEADPNDEAARASLRDEPEEQEAASIPQIPQTMLQFLLVSGRRRSMVFEPETTVGRVKELVWNTWPNDWQDERPPAPSYLRILHLGKILQDDDTLLQLKFPSHIPPEPGTPSIVHLSVRSFAPRGDSAVKKKRRNQRSADAGEAGVDAETGEHAGSCCCVIC